MASLPNRNAAGRAQVAREALQRMDGADVHDLIGSSAEKIFFTPLAWDEVLLLHGPMAEATINFHAMKSGMVGDDGRIRKVQNGCDDSPRDQHHALPRGTGMPHPYQVLLAMVRQGAAATNAMHACPS